MAEYYIRQQNAEDSRGPYSIHQIADLAEAGQVDQTTLYYDEDREEWLALAGNPEIAKAVFPEKRSLGLKSRERTASKGTATEEDGVTLTVSDMLAAAEGNTEETKHLKRKSKLSEKAAAMSMPVLGVIFLLSAFAFLYPGVSVIQTILDEKEYALLLDHPMLMVGILDLFLALCCFLHVTDIFPFLRFRAMLGLGYFTYTFWALQDTKMMLAAVVSSLCIFVITITLNLPLMILCIVLGIGGMAMIAVSAFFG